MRSMLFVLRCSIINSLKGIVKKPGAIIAGVVLIGFFVWAVSQGDGAENTGAARDWYPLLVMFMFGFIAGMSVAQGIKRGTAIFTMADVNMLFVAPINPRKVLLYAMLKQAGTLVFASLFLIAQYANLKTNFGLGTEALIGMIIGYILAGILSQLLSANLYAYCASHPKRRRVVDNVLRIILIALVIGFVAFVIHTGDALGALHGFFGGDWWNYVPVLGWARAIALYTAAGDWTTAFVYMGLMLLAFGGLVFWLARSDADYYEDVLTATENVQAMKEAAKEGRMISAGKVSKRVKRDMGELSGKGASALFYRAMRERRRRSNWMLSLTTIAAAVAPCFGMIFLSDVSANDIGLWPVLYFAAYLLIFLSMGDNVSHELTRHYPFVIPASPFCKLAAISIPRLFMFAVDSLVFFAVILLVLRPGIMEAVFATFAYFSIGAVFTSGMLLIEKLLSGMKLKIAIILVYMIIFILLMLPGFIAGTVLSDTIPACFYFGYFVSAIWNLLVSAIIVLICRNLLNTMER